jgi:hypothetical protein
MASTRPVPITHYVLAVTFGAIVTIAAALISGATNPADFWQAAFIAAICAGFPAVSLGWKIFVTSHTVVRDARGGESAEVRWLQRAAAGAFLDVVVAGTAATIVLLIARPSLEALPVLLGLLVLCVVDAGIRYAVIRWRALR